MDKAIDFIKRLFREALDVVDEKFTDCNQNIAWSRKNLAEDIAILRDEINSLREEISSLKELIKNK